MSKALCFVQITAKHQGCPFLTVFLAIKTSSHNISITLLQISLKLDEHRGRYWRKKLPWTILEEQFPVPRYIAASKIGNSVISLLWQLRCRCNPDHNKFSSLSTANPGSVIVPQYDSSKITVFVWGKNTILKFVGNTKYKSMKLTLQLVVVVPITPRKFRDNLY